MRSAKMSGKVNLDRWGPHVRAAKRQGKSVKQYAAEHGLSPYTLYAAREMLKAGARAERSEARAGSGLSAFAEVKLPVAQEVTARLPIASMVPTLRARLPNGVALELCCEGTDASVVRTVIGALMGRR
jgi:transposase-like protein